MASTMIMQDLPASRVESAGELERRLFRIGLVLVTLATGAVVSAAGIDLEGLALIVVVVASMLLVRDTGAELPFLVMTAHLLVSTVYAACFLRAGETELPEYYAGLAGAKHVLWLGMYPFFAAFGVRLATWSGRRKLATVTLSSPQIPRVLLFPAWLLFIVGAMIKPDVDNVMMAIVIHNVVPLLTIAVVVRLRNTALVMAAVALSLVAATLTTYRYVFGEYLLAYVLAYLLMARTSFRLGKLGMPLLLGGLILGSVTFYGMTFLKYGEYPSGHLLTRITLVQAHSAMRIKEAVDDGTALTSQEKRDLSRYWLGLVPFTGKPINSGHFTYMLSRQDVGADEDIPYLPPSAPAELYLTGGWLNLLLGALLHGLLLGLAWRYAGRFAGSPLQMAGFVLIVTVLCGPGGGADLYGRLEATKWMIYVTLLFWTMAAIVNRGWLLSVRMKRGAGSQHTLNSRSGHSANGMTAT